MILKFLTKLLIFLAIILALQCLVARPVEWPHELINLKAALKQAPDIIYFGDSTTTYYPQNDLTTQSTPEILWHLLPNSSLWALVHNAYDMAIYEDYVHYIVQHGFHPKFLIIPINLRDYSAVWNLNPNTQFNSDEFIINYNDTPWIKFYHPLGVFKYFEPSVSMYTWEHTPITFNNKSFGIIKDLYDHIHDTTNENIKFRNAFILNYMYTLKPEHPRIQSMLRIIHELDGTCIKPIFYITPIDAQMASQLIGNDFMERLSVNIQLIKSLLSKESTPLLDLSVTVPSEFFAWRADGYPLEHMNYIGRLFVARSLAEESDLKIYK